MNNESIPPCGECGQHFNDIFEATDHMVEAGGEEEFDPKLILPGGYTLMVGSLLRCLYDYANNPDMIKSITQSTYATLYAAEASPGTVKTIIEDMVVREQMSDFDTALAELLENESDDNEDGA
jgi:hypothetical protein